MRGKRTTCRLQKATTTTSGAGTTYAREDVQEFYGILQPVSQNEQNLADAETPFNEYVLLVGYRSISAKNRSEIKNKNRVVIDTRTFNIVGVPEYSGRGRHWTLRLKEITGREG